jgi:hypothetical protein
MAAAVDVDVDDVAGDEDGARVPHPALRAQRRAAITNLALGPTTLSPTVPAASGRA